MKRFSVEDLEAGIKGQDRRMISKAITLIESTLPSDEILAEELLTRIMPLTGQCLRIGISGIPGVGKSTFIERFGHTLIEKGKRVAVLAVDPSSPITGGSIMGDKTRMESLSVSKDSFIRPSPSGSNLGGVARKTREASLIAEAGGYDIIIIETVGVGQSEVVVSSMVDAFLVLQMPSTGDELQSVKKGILEVADVLVINKADGDLKNSAARAAQTHKQAFQLVQTHSSWTPPVVPCSSIEGEGVKKVWGEIERFVNHVKKDGAFDARRESQVGEWFDRELRSIFLSQIAKDAKAKALLEKFRKKALDHTLSPTSAARQYLRKVIR